MSDIVYDINDQFDSYQSLLVIKDKKLKLLVDFSMSVDELISMLDECYSEI